MGVGRNIYVSPAGNDTIYFNYPDNFYNYNEGFMPVGTTKNQEAAKIKFRKAAKKAIPQNNTEALKRAKSE